MFLHVAALADYVKDLKMEKGALLHLQEVVYFTQETVRKNAWKLFWEVVLK